MSEEMNHIPEPDEQLRAKKRKRRVRFAILYPAILIALSFLCFFLYRIGDFVHVCRIEPGTTVVDSRSIKNHAEFFNYFFRSAKFEKLQPYLMYRHYVILDGATEIREFAFNRRSNVRSVRIRLAPSWRARRRTASSRSPTST